MSSMDRMCLICMENNLTSTIALYNKKNRQKTQTCVSFEALTNLEVILILFHKMISILIFANFR